MSALNNFSAQKELIVKSTTNNLSIVRDFVREAALEAGADESAVDKIILAVDEACTNVIKHAYKYSPEGDINVSVRTDNNRFVIEITDQGIIFDPYGIPEPDIKKYYKERRVGGLGMFLMKKLMDEVNYMNVAGNRNRVRLVKYLS